MFPVTWSADKIMNAISDVATNPDNVWIIKGAAKTRAVVTYGPDARFSVLGFYDGVWIEVITTQSELITAYPL